MMSIVTSQPRAKLILLILSIERRSIISARSLLAMLLLGLVFGSQNTDTFGGTLSY
jgi:hypothetical protein